MNRTSFRRASSPASLCSPSPLLTACGAGNEPTPPATTAPRRRPSGDLNGGGASSQEKAQAAWRAGFQTTTPDVTINYDPVGSGTGRENFISEAYAFAGTDSDLNDDEGELTAAKERCGGEDPIQVPAYVSPIAVVFNLEGVDSLNLVAETIANDLRRQDHEVERPGDRRRRTPTPTLPDTAITPVHRQDDSGTTENFTDYLGKAGDGAWSYEPDGLARVKGRRGRRGHLRCRRRRQRRQRHDRLRRRQPGRRPRCRHRSRSARSTSPRPPRVPPRWSRSRRPPRVAPTSTWPSTSTAPPPSPAPTRCPVSYLIACQTYDDAGEADLVKGFLAYVVSDEGQQAAADEAGSAPLDAALAANRPPRSSTRSRPADQATRHPARAAGRHRAAAPAH